MNAITISDARRFSLAAVQRNVLAELPGLTLEVLGFLTAGDESHSDR